MKRNHRLLGAAVALGVFGITSIASASSHREAPAIALDPAADNTDVWAWVTPGSHSNLTIVAAYNPLEEPSGGPNFHKFSDDVLYSVHITRGVNSLEDAVRYDISFTTSSINYVDPSDLTQPLGGGKEFFAQLAGQTQTYTVTKTQGGHQTVIASGIPVAPVNIGPRTDTVVYKEASGSYDDAFAATFIHAVGAGKERLWAGPRDDGFYVDLGGVFDLANLRAVGTAQDGVSGFNCHAIALEIPTGLLTGTGKAPTGVDAELLGVWASASRQKVSVIRRDGTNTTAGPWVQVSRLAFPLINEAVIGLQDKDHYNRSEPKDDVTNYGAYFLNPVIVRDANAVGIYQALGVPASTVTALESNRLDIIDTLNIGNANIPLSATGDVLRVNMGVDSKFPNGRMIGGGGDGGGLTNNKDQVDVTDTILSVVLAKGTLAVSDNVNYNDKAYLTAFPYLAGPWQGYSQGHGLPTP